MKKLLTSALLFISLAFSTSSHAAEKLFELLQSTRADTGADAQVGRVAFTSIEGDALEIGDEYDIVLPSGAVVSGEVVLNSGAPVQGHGEEFVSASTNSKVLALRDTGALEVHLVENTIAGITLNDTVNGKIYRAEVDQNGTGNLAEIDPNSILCTDLPLAPDTQLPARTLAQIPAGLTEDVIRNLESRPGAANTIFIDSWGGVVEDTLWNATYNNGEPIVYTPYSYDLDTVTFSEIDKSYIWLAWAEVAEDYADFDVNITTSRSVFEAASIPNRSQMIATTTCAWFGCGFGGVAYVTSFGENNELKKIGWVWNSKPRSTGMSLSHEAGHQMGLAHDGTTNSEYYEGHGSWGSIMGVPFGQPYVQWSKGEYENANNQQDDLAILAQMLGLRADDAGDANASASRLEPTTGTNFMITQNGLEPDVDVFAFTLGASQEVSIDVAPTLAIGGEARAANAAFNVSLANSSGTVLASTTSSDNTPLRPDTNTFSSTSTLDAGTYYLTVDAVSPDTNWATGFGEYGNGGEYRLSADFVPGIGISTTTPSMTTPAANATLAGNADTFTWAANGTDVTEYWVYVGSDEGLADYSNSRSLSSSTLSYSSTNLPLDGSTVHVRLFWLEEGQTWQSVDYTYSAIEGTGPAFTSPLSGDTLAGVNDTFQWTGNDVGVSEYWLYLGSEVGNNDYHDSGSIADVTSDAITADSSVRFLPTDGSVVYARLWHRGAASDNWRFVDETFTAAASGGPAIISPAPGSVISGSPVTLNWETGGADVNEWWIYVGTNAGLSDIYNSGSLGASLSDSVSLPGNGATVHVTLWYKIDQAWRSTNYIYESNSGT